MNITNSEVLYIGFLLPGLFALTLVVEGVYKMVKREGGIVTFFMGTFFLVGLVIALMFLRN